jgi:hypothetical protein
MPSNESTPPTRTSGAGWSGWVGFGVGGAVGGLIWALLMAVEPESAAAWWVPTLGWPGGAIAAAAMPVRRGRPFRVGLALGGLLAVVACFGYVIATIPYA